MTATMTAARLRLSNHFRRTRGDSLQGSLAHLQHSPTTQDELHLQTEEEYEEEEIHNSSVREAHEWLKETIRESERWTADHLSQIRIECSYTLPELHQLGRLPRAEGLPKCQALIRVPVIYDEIGLFVWTTLAEMELELGGAATCNELEEIEEDRLAAEMRQQRATAFLASLDERFRFDRPGRMISGLSIVVKDKQSTNPATEKSTSRRGHSSPSVSPKGTRTRRSLSSSPPMPKRRMSDKDCSFCRQESIEEVPEWTIDEEDHDVGVRGRVLKRQSTQSVGFFNVSRSSIGSSYRRSLARRSEDASFHGSAPNAMRSETLGEKVKSTIAGRFSRTVTALEKALSHAQKRSSPPEWRRVKSI